MTKDLPILRETVCPDGDANAPHRVAFRQAILRAETELRRLIDAGVLEDKGPEASLKHYYSPIHEEYGCCAYARLIVLPKGSHTIGKIHRHEHLNFILQGAVRVYTEHGQDRFAAPLIFVSSPHTKRAVYAEEETLWATVHLTKHRGEENLDKMEDEIIAKNYSDLGLMVAPEQFSIGEWLRRFAETGIGGAP